MEEEVSRFMGRNDDLKFTTDEGVILRFEKVDSWIKMYIEVSENTSRAAVDKAWPLINEWRERLQKHQGIWLAGGDNEFYEQISREARHSSYAKVATRLNSRIAELFQMNVAFEKEYLAAKPKFKNYLDEFSWVAKESKNNPFSGEHAHDLMELMGIDENDRNEIARFAIENIKSGEPAFHTPNTPITREMVREKIRWWRNRQKTPEGGWEELG